MRIRSLLPSRTVWLALGLLVVAGWLGQLSDRLRLTPRPESGIANVLGGFSALAVQVLWMRAQLALQEQRTADALLQFELIMELEPHRVANAGRIALELGYNMPSEHEDPTARWELVKEALHVLDRCVEATSGAADARKERGTFLFDRWRDRERSADLWARFEDEFGRTPFDAAADDLQAAVAGLPDDLMSRQELGLIRLDQILQTYPAWGPREVERIEEAVRVLREWEALKHAAGIPAAQAELGVTELAAALEGLIRAAPDDRAGLESDFRERFSGVLPPR